MPTADFEESAYLVLDLPAPRQPGKGDAVYLAFPHALARKIQDRLAPGSPAELLIPPA